MGAMQFQQFLQAVLNLMTQGAAVGGGAERKEKRGRVMVEKGYNRLSKFSTVNLNGWSGHMTLKLSSGPNAIR